MAYRKLPFGYQMRQGKIEECSTEVETLRWIFRHYSAGGSYKKITEELRRKDVPYLPGKPWNKNMVARILADQRYTGTDGFPQLIEPALYQSIQEVVTCRTTPFENDEGRSAVQWFAICAVCGGKVRREPWEHGRERWQCPQCRSVSTKATDRKLVAETRELLNALIHSSDAVRCPDMETENSCSSIQCVETEFKQMLNTPDFDESSAKAKALSLAAARFDVLGSEDYETTRIQYILARAEQSNELDIALLRQITSAILIHPDGAVSLKLKNGQILERKDIP